MRAETVWQFESHAEKGFSRCCERLLDDVSLNGTSQGQGGLCEEAVCELQVHADVLKGVAGQLFCYDFSPPPQH